MKQGKWFDGRNKRKEAEALAIKKEVSAWEIQYKSDGRTVFYVGEKLPQRIVKEMSQGKIHVLLFGTLLMVLCHD
jgi:hypothetical protein